MDNFYNPIHNSVVASSLKALAALCVMVYMSTLLRHSEEKFVSSIRTENETNATLVITTIENVSVRHVETQPHCPGSHVHAILREILVELYAKRETCTPQDIYNVEKHKVPKITSKTNKNAEPKGAMVVYIAVGLLLMSLGAAFVEVFKAKQQPTEKSKPSLNRRCSLADLTVLRHNRKELMRRDSVMDMGDHRVASKQLGRKVSRPPLRLE